MENIGELSFCRSDLIGEGHYGCVFKGKCDMDDAAVKRLRKRYSQVESHIFRKADRHPNIIRYFCTKDNDVEFIYLATELCSGTLDDLVKGRYTGPSVGSRLEVLRQVLKGIEHLHLLKIVHGDLKPSNILISIPSGTVGPIIKLTDFGLRHSCKSFSLSGDRDREFTPAYTESWSAPEPTLTFASDMFSFALVCWFSLSDGRHPHGEHDLERIGRIKSCAPILLTADQLKHVDPSAAAQVLELIQLLLSKEADQRPTAAQMLKHELFESESVSSTASVQSFAAGSKIKQEQPNEDDDIVILSEKISPKKSTVEESTVREMKAQLSTDATSQVQHSVSSGSANNRQTESLIKGPEKRKKPEVEISNKKEKSALAAKTKPSLNLSERSSPTPGSSRLAGLKESHAAATVKIESNESSSDASFSPRLDVKKFVGDDNSVTAGSPVGTQHKTTGYVAENVITIEDTDEGASTQEIPKKKKTRTSRSEIRHSQMCDSDGGARDVSNEQQTTQKFSSNQNREKQCRTAGDNNFGRRSEEMSTAAKIKGKDQANNQLQVDPVENKSAPSSSRINPRSTATDAKLHKGNGVLEKENISAPVSPSSQSTEPSTDEEDSDDDGAKIHNEKGLNKCGICEKQFASKSSLKYHMNKHTGSKPFECDMCKKTFGHPESLRNHLKTHLAPRYECDLCLKKFTLSSILQVHLKTHSAPTYECDLCLKKFTTSSNLQAHLKTHAEPEFECEFCHKKFHVQFNLKLHRDGNKNRSPACKVRRQQQLTPP